MNIAQNMPLHVAANVAEWHAKTALRYGRQGNDDGFVVHQNRMYDVLETSPYPRLATQEIVKRLGRGKSMVLQIDRDLINLAL